MGCVGSGRLAGAMHKVLRSEAAAPTPWAPPLWAPPAALPCDLACRLPHAQADGLRHREDLPDEGLAEHQPQHQGDRADPARLCR